MNNTATAAQYHAVMALIEAMTDSEENGLTVSRFHYEATRDLIVESFGGDIGVRWGASVTARKSPDATGFRYCIRPVVSGAGQQAVAEEMLCMVTNPDDLEDEIRVYREECIARRAR